MLARFHLVFVQILLARLITGSGQNCLSSTILYHNLVLMLSVFLGVKCSLILLTNAYYQIIIYLSLTKLSSNKLSVSSEFLRKSF